MMMKKIHILALLIPCFLVSACSGDTVQDKLGLKRTVPDEFSVVKHAPLAMPPEYTLHAPRPGAPRPQEQAVIEEAREAVFGAMIEKTIKQDISGETLLLQQAGATQIDPNIRDTVDKETTEINERNEYIGQKLLGLGGLGGDDDNVLNAKEELERLRAEKITAAPL